MFLLLACPKSFAYIWAWKIFTCYLLLFCGIVDNLMLLFLNNVCIFFPIEYEYDLTFVVNHFNHKYLFYSANVPDKQPAYT